MKIRRILPFLFIMLTLTLTSCNTRTPSPGDEQNPPLTPTEGIVYRVDADGAHAEVIEYTGEATEIVIADTYNGLPVRVIGEKAFYRNDRITSVIVPDSVRSIGDSAFHSCSKLENVTLPEGVEIESYAFEDCSLLLTQYDFCMYVRANGNPHAILYRVLSKMFDTYKIHEDTEYIGYGAFSGCRSIKEIAIPDGVAVIGNSAFKSCSGLVSVTIPDSVIAIGENAFQASGIGSVTIGKGVATIGEWAFANCDNLRSVIIPDNVSAIGDHAFGWCESLVSIDAGADGTYYSIDGNLYAGTTLVQYPQGKRASSFEIPDFVTAVGNYAFADCSELTSVTIPDFVTAIGNHAFAGCFGLTSVTIPDFVTAIGNHAFSGCSGLTSVTIPDGVTHVGEGAFGYCSSLVNIDAGTDGLYYSLDGNLYTGTTLAQYPSGKDAATFEIPDFVTVIGNYAFAGCSGLASVTIPDGVTALGKAAFYMCPLLASVTIGDGVTSIGDSAFGACMVLASVTMGSGVKTIGDAAFQNCSVLSSITIPESVSYIGVYAIACGATTVVFENTEGWVVENATSTKAIPSTDLKDATAAAKCVGFTYTLYTWTRR